MLVQNLCEISLVFSKGYGVTDGQHLLETRPDEGGHSDFFQTLVSKEAEKQAEKFNSGAGKARGSRKERKLKQLRDEDVYHGESGKLRCCS